MPIPGKPGRSLGLPSKVEDNQPDAESLPDASAEEPKPALLNFLPHEFRGGGIGVEAIYTGESFTKAHGGLSNGSRTNYRSNFDLVGTLDTGKMGWWDRGRLFVYGQTLSGRPLSLNDVGDFQLFSNLDSTFDAFGRPQFTTIAEYWYDQFFFDDKVRIKIGKQDANVDFILTDLGGEFVNSSFGFPPLIPIPTFPNQALGISTFFKLNDITTLGLAIYDGSLPNGPTGVRWGFDTLGHHGAISLCQLEYKPVLEFSRKLPSTLRVGMWQHSDKNVWTEFTSDPDPRTFSQNYGCFGSLDQMIYKESADESDDQGLGVFCQFGWAPPNRNILTEYYGGGFVYKGLLPGRDADVTGVAFASALFGGPYRQVNDDQGITIGHAETATEFFYKWIYSKTISFQPDIQYIAHPNGRYRDAFVPGFRFEMIL